MPTDTEHDTTEAETPTEAPTGEPTGAEPAETPAASETGAEAPEEPLSAVEAAVAEGPEAIKVATGTLEVSTPAGMLTLRPNQTDLDENQKAALVAIGIDAKNDPGVVPHAKVFIHMCQARGLDPFAREAYLIGRGKGEKRKWTMQTGIDGYRKMAASTNRLIRVADVLWTGQDDDDRSYRPDASGVMRRVWYDQWPASRGYPGAAKAIVEHYDEITGQVVQTEAVADWGMYAPYNDVWRYDPSKGKRVQVFDDQGKPVQELSAMWVRGGAFMLAKCAEALAYRKAFPARLNGFYVTEEMHRLDATERQRVKVEQAETRRAAYAAATQTPTGPLPADEDDDGVETPTHVSEAVEEVVDGVIVGDPADLLRTELDFQAEALGKTPAALANRQVRALRKNLDDFTAEELLPLVLGFRIVAAEAIGRTDEARAAQYRQAYDGRDGAMVLPWDEAGQDASDEGHDPSDDEALDADPEKPHRYVDDGSGACALCGDSADDMTLHIETDA